LCGDFNLQSEAMSARRHINAYLCAVLIFSACSTGSVDIKIDESPQGAVYLKRITDRSFQSAHPIKIDQSTIALVLNGILIHDDQRALQNFVGSPDASRAFSGSEVGYLAPLISEALRRAASNQQVGFRVEQVGQPGLSKAVGGVLYAYGRSLYVTLTQYHSKEEPATTNMTNSRTANATGLANRTVSFIPEAAKRPDSFLDARSTDKTLVIDYELLAMLPPASMPSASAQSVPLPAPPQATNGGKAEPARDAEIEALRKELQEIKKQLAEQQAERTRSKNMGPQK
jgi:hypothetical protein